jgi:ABC-type Fe3+/spermidine/putrescine transport system ATPase subunit
MTARPFLKATGLTVAGRLDDISFDLALGSTLAVLGPSGSGKTTLLRLLAGFEAAPSGAIEIDGELVSSRGRVIVPPERRGLAFAFQEPALMPHLDAIANVHLGVRETSAIRIAAARQALADVGLPGFEQRRVWELSGGEAQRIQLARTLAFESRMLLLDEPFASVDRMCRADLLSRIGERIRHRARHGIAAIVTHDPADAMELSDVTMVLKAGRIVAYGAFDRIAGGDFGDWPARFLAAGFAGREIA